MRPFQLLIKPVSFDCNLGCTYCFYLRVKEVYPKIKKPKMTFVVLESLISQYLNYRFKESIFGWQGGEPTLAGLDFFKKVVELQQQHGISGQVIGNALQTNGLLINSEWAQFLNKYKFLVGLSLDGPKRIHDRHRKTKSGASVWDKVIRTADLMRENQVEFNILCVISKANVNQAKEVYDFFIQNDFRYLQFIPALEADAMGKRASFSVSSAQYGQFLCDLFDEWKHSPHGISIRLFDGMISHYLGNQKGLCSLEQKCADYLLIEWNGDVYPCDFFVDTTYKLGNLVKTSLSVLKNKRDNQFGNKKLLLSQECEQCTWLDSCYGGCMKDRIFKDNPHPDRTFFCEAYMKFFNHSDQWFREFTEGLKHK